MAKKKTKTQIISDKNKKEIFWNIVNSILAGSLVFFGAFINGGFSWEGVLAAAAASLIVAITKFKDYWSKEKNEYCKSLANFV